MEVLVENVGLTDSDTFGLTLFTSDFVVARFVAVKEALTAVDDSDEGETIISADDTAVDVVIAVWVVVSSTWMNSVI